MAETASACGLRMKPAPTMPHAAVGETPGIGIIDVPGRKSVLVPVPFPIARLIGLAGDIQARLMAPVLTSDQVELLKYDNVPADGMPGLRELGVTPTAVEAIVPAYLYRYRKGGQYADLPAPVG